MSIPGIYSAISSANAIAARERAEGPHSAAKPTTEFRELLESQLKEGQLKLSQHAESRIKSRSIEWSPEVQKRIESGIEMASSKGSREALILADNVAVIANVQSKTVVTAMDRESLVKGKIFTNIDSTVLV